MLISHVRTRRVAHPPREHTTDARRRRAPAGHRAGRVAAADGAGGRAGPPHAGALPLSGQIGRCGRRGRGAHQPPRRHPQ
eukprot:4663777-Prymnesium_polylepis.1